MKQRAKRGFTLMELLVVIGIAALLITMASTSFFGALRQEDRAKAENELCDALRSARQNACISGKAQVVICWNTEREIQVGNDTERIQQGMYATFQYIGNAWLANSSLYVPFGLQREMMGNLSPNARIINLLNPSALSFAKVGGNRDYEHYDADDDVIEEQLAYPFQVQNTKVTDLKGLALRVAQLSSSANLAGVKDSVSEMIPIGMRITRSKALPTHYAFDGAGGQRIAIVFNPDGTVGDGAGILKASNRKSPNNPQEIAVDVTANGAITVKKR